MGVQGSCLWAYAITSTLVAIIFVSLFTPCRNDTDIVTGNEQKIVKYDILTLDQSETADDSEFHYTRAYYYHCAWLGTRHTNDQTADVG